MKLRRPFLVAIAWSVALAAAEPVVMKDFRVTPSSLALNVRSAETTGLVEELVVTDVRAGSPAEKLGIQKGDIVTAIDGKPVVGRQRSELFRDQAVMMKGAVTFVGHRGLFRRAWTLTVMANQLRKNPGAPSTEPAAGEK